MPKLKNRELFLAFLLGYYDGDGDQSTIRITSGIRIFLKQIKTMFNIKYALLFYKTECYDSIRDVIVKGSSYSLCLGPNLFNELLYNYEFSLKRKRNRKYNLKERLEKANRARLSKKQNL